VNTRSHLGIRIAGLAVAVTVMVAAGQLLAVSFDQQPLVGTDLAGRIERWVRSTPSSGAATLAGAALVVTGVWLIVLVIRSRVSNGGVVTVHRRKRSGGGVAVDRNTLADALQRELSKVDQRADVDVHVRRSGRIDLDVVTPDPTPTGSVLNIRERLDEIVAERHLPCRSGRIRSTRPRKVKGRRRVR
jgi:hypothetical protein